MAWRPSHGLWYGLVGIAWYMIMACQTRCGAWHSIWYGLVGIAWYMVWPGGQRMVYGKACWARHDIWYGLVTMAWYMLWPGWHHMVYGMAWRTSQGICYGLARCVMAWRGMSWYVVRHSITCFKALSLAISRSHVEWSMSAGGSVHMYRTRSQVDGLLHAIPFTRTAPVHSGQG